MTNKLKQLITVINKPPIIRFMSLSEDMLLLIVINVTDYLDLSLGLGLVLAINSTVIGHIHTYFLQSSSRELPVGSDTKIRTIIIRTDRL